MTISVDGRSVTLTERECVCLTELCQGLRTRDGAAERTLFRKLEVASVYGAVKCAIACGFVGTYSR